MTFLCTSTSAGVIVHRPLETSEQMERAGVTYGPVITAWKASFWSRSIGSVVGPNQGVIGCVLSASLLQAPCLLYSQ